MPMCREVNPSVVVAVASDQTSQCGERQVEAINRMREQQRVTVWCIDCPEIRKFNQKLAGFKQRRTIDLPGVVKSDRRPRETYCPARRRLCARREFPVLD